MEQDRFSVDPGKAFTYTENLEGGETLQAHSYGNGNFIHGIPTDDVEVCFSLYKIHDILDIHIHDVDLFQWLYKINSLREGFSFNATTSSISMALLLPYYHEVREKFNKDRSQGLGFEALELFVLHFLRDRSIFAIFGLDDLYQAGTLTETHFRDLDSWDWSIFKNLDRLDDMVDELDERGEPDDLEGLGGPHRPDEPDDQDQEDPCQPVVSTDDTARSGLLASVGGCDEESVDRMLRKDPRIVNADDILCTALHHYNLTNVDLLFGDCTQLGGDFRSVPLCAAAENGKLDVVKLLLARGADPEGNPRVTNWTPLDLAAYRGHFEIVRYLIEEQRADIHGSWHHRPLWCAIEKGHTQIVDYLLASGANVFEGRLPSLSYAGLFHMPDPGDTDYRDNFKHLIPNCCARTRYLLLSKAAADGDLHLVKYTVSFGVDVNSVTNESPLYHATKKRRSDVVRFLLGHAKNIQPAHVSDLLWCAAENDDVDIIYLLLGCGPQLCPRLLGELLSVAAGSSDRYGSKADKDTHDELSLCLPKDESFAEWDSSELWNHGEDDWFFWSSLRETLIARERSEKRKATFRKLAAKIESALEKVHTDFGYRAFMSYKSKVQRCLNREVTDEEAIDLEECPTVAAIQAQERRTKLRQVLANLGKSCKILLHAGASQDASTELRHFVYEAETEAPRTVWRGGTRAIRSIVEGHLPSSVPDIVRILQVANAMRSAVSSSDLVCSRREFVNDIPKWAALLNQEDQNLFLEIATYLWGLPPLEKVPQTLDPCSILEDLKQLVSSVMRASGLFDYDSEHSSSFYRLQSLRQHCISEMRDTHAHEGEFSTAEWRPPPAPNLQETPRINSPLPPDPERGQLSTFDEIVYLFAGAIFGAILLFLYLSGYGYSTMHPPLMASDDKQRLIPDQIMGRNCVILALYIGATSHFDLGKMPYLVSLRRAEGHLAAFESHTEGNSIAINSPGAVDTAMEEAPNLPSKAPTSSSTTSVSPSTTTMEATPDLTRPVVSDEGYIYCGVISCTSSFKPGKSQKGNYKKHLRDQHVKDVMYKCKWGCGRERPQKFNIEVHERTCKERKRSRRSC